jgi:two-component system sensor histidine kinase YesM
MSSSILELLEKNKAIEEDKRKIEIEALQTQINPHFLYNTLNTFKWLAVLSNANNVAEGLTVLGNLLRPIYNNKGALWSLKEENDFMQNYIKVMNYRYGGGIFVTVLFPEDLMEYKVLTFMLQPILENSFTHGLKAQGNSGEISITAYSEGEDIFFEIKDNGEGMSEEKLKEIQKALETNMIRYGSNGMSISNVNRRIKLNYGEEYGIHLTSSVGFGTVVTIKIPKVKIL